MFYNRTKRQKNIIRILKFTRKKYDCDNEIEKVQGRYEFNVYHPFKKDLEDYLKNFNVQIISVSDEGGDFVVVREIR